MIAADNQKETKKNGFYKDPRYKKWSKAQKTLNDRLLATFTVDINKSNGLLESFGNQAEIMGIVGEALLGDRQKFDEFIRLFEECVLPAIELAKELREYIDKGNKKDKARARELFQKFRKIQSAASNRNQVVADIRKAFSHDRLQVQNEKTSAYVAETGVQNYDTEQFREVLPEWKELKKKKDTAQGLSEKEASRFAKLSEDLVQSRNTGLNIKELKDHEYQEKQLDPWFLDKQDGKNLSRAFEEFKKLRERDIELRKKRWDDDSLLAERNAAEQRFLDIYKRIGTRRLRAHMKAYEEQVPEETAQRDFNAIFNDIMNSGPGFLGFNTNQMKIGAAIGMKKAYSYQNGTFEPGLDLEDSIPEKFGEEPKVILLPSNREDDEEDD